MVKIVPPQARSVISDDGDALQITIPTRKNWFLILFMGAWMGGWFMGETSAIGQLTGERSNSGGDAFLMFWLAAWTVGGVFALFTWLWNLAGIERVMFRGDSVLIRREVLGVGFTREYDATQVRNLRLSGIAPSNMFAWRNSGRFWGQTGGMITFDYGSSTVQFGGGIDEAEAAQLVERAQSRFPALRGK